MVAVESQRGAVDTTTSASLRKVIDAQRAQQRETTVTPGADHQLSGGVTGVHEVLIRKQIAAVQSSVDLLQHLHIGDGRIGGSDVGDEVR